MKKFLCALLALTLIVSPTGQNACSAAETDTTETTQASEEVSAPEGDTDASQDAMQEHVADSTPVEALDATQISTNKDERFWKKALRLSGSVLGAPIDQVAGWWQSKTDDEKKAFVVNVAHSLSWVVTVHRILGCIFPRVRHRGHLQAAEVPVASVAAATGANDAVRAGVSALVDAAHEFNEARLEGKMQPDQDRCLGLLVCDMAASTATLTGPCGVTGWTVVKELRRVLDLINRCAEEAAMRDNYRVIRAQNILGHAIKDLPLD